MVEKQIKIKPWKPKKTFKDVIYKYGNEIDNVQCDNDQLRITIILNYDSIPEEMDDDLQIIVDTLNEHGGNFTISPRAKFRND
jgi:hypothetical protein